MASSAKMADLEALLRVRHLDRTLTSTRIDRPAEQLAPVGLSEVDIQIHGGFPRGQLSELVGTRSAGRTSVLHALLAAATARGEFVALVDTLDTFDPTSAAEAGVDLDRLLWVRGLSITQETTIAPAGDLYQRACERALKAFNLILQVGETGTPFCVVLDLVDVPALVIQRIPFITWLRLQRVIEGRDGLGLIVADISLGRSARGITLHLAGPIEASPPQRSPWQIPPLTLSPLTLSSHL
jgi:hypothetical protein